MLALVSLASSLVLVSTLSFRPAQGLSDGVMFGAFAQPRAGESSREAVESLERQLGVTLPIVRSFGRFDSPLDSTFHRLLARDERIVLDDLVELRGRAAPAHRSTPRRSRVPGRQLRRRPRGRPVQLERGCRGNPGERWQSLAETTRPFLEWSRAHPTKPLVLPEFGSVDASPDHLFGGHGADALAGRGGADSLSGGSKIDGCDGGSGRDRIGADCERQT